MPTYCQLKGGTLLCNFSLISLIFFSAHFKDPRKCFAEMPLLFLLGSIRGSLIDSLRNDLNTVSFSNFA